MHGIRCLTIAEISLPVRSLVARCSSLRQWLWRRRAGRFGLRSLVWRDDQAVQSGSPNSPLAPRPPHFAAKAKSVIFLYMDGGPSQVDTFDPKPRLDREHGQPIKMKTHPTQFNNVGNVLKSPWKFRQYGESGIPVSDLFPHVGRRASTTWRSSARWSSNFSEHTNANYFLHTGSGHAGPAQHGRLGRPTAWAASARTCPASSCSTAA